MTIDSSSSLREIVRTHPGAPRVFAQFHLDFCCGGARPLGDVCEERRVELEEIVTAIEAADQELATKPAPGGFDPRRATAAEIIGRLLDHHHVAARRSVETLRALAPTVLGAHGGRHPELKNVVSIVEAIGNDLIPHMQHEESHEFPAILAAERRLSPVGRGIPTLDHAIRMLDLEHQLVGTMLHELDDLTDHYQTPPDACPTWRAFYSELARFHADLIDHVSLENNFLLPLAQAMVGDPRRA